MPITNAPVLVTGVTGFICAEITRQLLEAGYRVRGTTRDPDKARREGHLAGLPGAADRLELMEADLLTPGAFDEAVEGCEYVMHVASPYVLDVEDPQRDLVDPAVNGTLSVLEAATSAGTVKRVVLTSSFAAIMGAPDGRVFTEADWNTEATLHFASYSYSKTRAERAAWAYMNDRRPQFDLVVINPTTVVGPSLIPGVNESFGYFVGLTNGSQPAIVPVDFPFVDVRDVALAHIRGMERDGANGRYIASAGNAGPRRVRDVAARLGFDDRYQFPKLSLESRLGVAVARAASRFQPKGTRDFLAFSLGRSYEVDTTKIRTELDISFRDLDETIAETWLDLEKWGHLTPKRGAKVRS